MARRDHDITTYTLDNTPCENPFCENGADVRTPDGPLCAACAADDGVGSQ